MRRAKWISALLASACGLLMPLSWGCNWLAGPLYLLSAEQTKKIPAEYGQLAGKRVCVWVWADDSVLFDFPALRSEVAGYAKHYIAEHVNASFVDPLAVEKFHRERYDADSLSPVEVGQHFDADVVLFIQVLDFRTRPIDSPNLFQGHVAASCALYDCRGEKPPFSPDRQLWTGQVEVTYPPRGPVGMMQSNEVTIRAQVLTAFAQELAKKFYDYTVKLGDQR